MLLAVDIGNSAIKFGIFEDGKLTSKFSIQTDRGATADSIRNAAGVLSGVDSAIVCSVVPTVEPAMRLFLSEVSDSEPVFVRNSFDFGLKINYEPLESLGTDRLVNAFAAAEIIGPPAIVCSLGTATTIDLVSADREFLGGVIAPGMDAMAEALHLKAPRLPRVDSQQPVALLGNTTLGAVASGIYNGYLAMVSGLIEEFRAIAGSDATVVATGGNADVISGEEVRVLPDLVLEGLRLLYRPAR